jgi:hypothetical protein
MGRFVPVWHFDGINIPETRHIFHVHRIQVVSESWEFAVAACFAVVLRYRYVSEVTSKNGEKSYLSAGHSSGIYHTQACRAYLGGC